MRDRDPMGRASTALAVILVVCLGALAVALTIRAIEALF